MSVSTTTNRVAFQGSGSSYPFSFPFFAQSDLRVYLYDATSGAATLQTLNTNYTIAGTVDSQGLYSSGGTIITASSIPTGLKVVIFRTPSQVQNYTLLQNGNINSKALVQQLDYITLLTQSLQDQASRSVHLAEGYGLTFDSTLPANINLMANQSLIVNSGATGFTFQSASTPYTPNTVIVAVSSSAIGSLTAGPAGYVLTSQGSSAPNWTQVSLSGSSVTGTLSLANGGTGGLAPQRWGVVYASSATELATTDPAPVGMALISNASSAPTFQQLSVVTGIVGTLPTANGGTGIPGPLTQYGVIYAPTTTTMGMIPSATAGFVLTANGSSAPSFQASSGGAPAGSSALLVVNNLSDVPNPSLAFSTISPLTTFGDLIYAGSAAIDVRLAAGTSGFFLQTQGAGAAPIWAATLANPMTTRGDVIFAGSAAVTSRLAAGSAGQFLTSNGTQLDPTWTSGLANPLTTLGDIIYAGSGAVLTRLAGNISNSSAVLTQTGSGGFSAAPTWVLMAAPQVSVLAGSSGTYTTPTSPTLPIFLRLRMVGPGGGGQGGGATGGTGTDGSSTVFGTFTALGGSAGGTTSGAGGSASAGADFAASGGDGSIGCLGNATNSNGGIGGNSLWGLGGGARGANAAGGIGRGFGGGGGGGGVGLATGQSFGGGGGAYFEKILAGSAILSSYAYVVGASCPGGVAGTSGQAGGVSSGGKIIIEAYF